MSPLVWDLGHIAAFEDLWLPTATAGGRCCATSLMDVYDASRPRGRPRRASVPARASAARQFLDEVRERTLEVLAERGTGDGFVAELVIRHEQQHGETMLQTLGARPTRRLPAPGTSR